MAVVGFDFGTTNSLISLIRSDQAVNYLDEGDIPFPSVVCYEGAATIVGQDAKQRLASAGLGVHGNVIRSPKSLLGKESVFVEGVERSPVDIVAKVVEFVCQQAATTTRRGRDLGIIDRAVVTIPVNMEGRRRGALRDAFRKAGVAIEQFIHEPLAALYGFLRSEGDYAGLLRQYDRKLILVFDWGGGTLDLTLCKIVDGTLVQIRNDGTEEVGGDVFDDTICTEVVRRVLEQRGIKEGVKIHPDAMNRLIHACEQAKIALSARDVVELYVGTYFRGIANEELSYTLSRDDLEKMTSQLLSKGLDRIRSLLDMAGVSTSQVALCLATGGMANMPAIKARLHEWFGAQQVHVSKRAGTLIAEGAAWVAHDRAKLHLAKNVELLLARNSYLPLIKAQAEMPTEGEVRESQFHLYCADPTDGFAKFQLISPVRPGSNVLPNDRREPLENLVVEVDAQARPLRERLELNVRIDDNLILHAEAKSLNRKSIATAEVHNLEFGLSLPRANTSGSTGNNDSGYDGTGKPQERGTLALRSNIADRQDDRLVPGEVLYRFNSNYFDVRSFPPEIQVEERLYYEPCSVCGCASNDPICRCSSSWTRPSLITLNSNSSQ